MKQNLTFWEILPVGLMLFSSFFGAGNLIFPPSIGINTGADVIPGLRSGRRRSLLVSRDRLLRYRRRHAASRHHCHGTH